MPSSSSISLKNKKISPDDKPFSEGDVSELNASLAEHSSSSYTDELLENRITAILERKGLVDKEREKIHLTGKKHKNESPVTKSRGYFNPYRETGLIGRKKTHKGGSSDSVGTDDDERNEDEDEDTESPLAESTYSLMMVSKVSGKGYIVGLITFVIEIVLLSLIFADQLAASDSSTIFDVPFRVSPVVRIGQFITILIVVLTSSDTLTSIKNLAFFTNLYRSGEAETWWREVFPDDLDIEDIASDDDQEAIIHNDDQEAIINNDEHKNSPAERDTPENASPEVVTTTPRDIAENSPLDLHLDDDDGHIITSGERQQALKRALRRTFFFNILIPNGFSLTQSILVLLVSFVIIVQSDNIIDLLKDFTSLMFISEINDIVFFVASVGYLGHRLKKDAKRSQSFQINDSLQIMNFCCGLVPARFVFLALLAMALLFGWLLIVYGQVSGAYFKLKYQDCTIPVDMIAKLSDEKCDGGVLNSIECGFDGGDCVDFNLAYPDCYVPDAFKVGDGQCDELYNKEECGYDGGDCCPYPDDDKHFFNGVCDGGYYNTKACNFDNGDCDQINLMFPVCPFEILASRIGAEMHPIVIGDNICQSGVYLLEECFFEGGDCVGCGKNGNVDPELIGDGFCNGREYMMEVCGNDGGDCDECFVDDPMKIGDGTCDGGAYNTEGCSFDGGDCLSINSQPNLVLPTDPTEKPSSSPTEKPSSSPTLQKCAFKPECSDSSVQFRPISKNDNAIVYDFTETVKEFVVDLPFTYEANLGANEVLSVNQVGFNGRTNIFLEQSSELYLYLNLMNSNNDPEKTLDWCSNNGGTDSIVATYQNEETSFLISFENSGNDVEFYANAQVELFSDGSINFCFGEGNTSYHHIWSYITEYSDIHSIQGEPFSGEFFVESFPANNCYCFECN